MLVAGLAVATAVMLALILLLLWMRGRQGPEDRPREQNGREERQPRPSEENPWPDEEDWDHDPNDGWEHQGREDGGGAEGDGDLPMY